MKPTIHTLESAPTASKPLLEESKKTYGMLPNLHGALAGSPELLTAYKALHGWFESTSLTEEERTVVWQTINVEHACHYCVPAHTAIAHMRKVDPAVTDALRDGTPLPTERLEVLRSLTLELVRNRGHVSKTQLEAFQAAGYTEQNLLEVVLGLAQKTISNYVNHLTDTPVDAPFQKFQW
ncbi:MAG: carboxymuconolactone decarboxylase family protein, partial [Myxococcota bacterium]